MDQHQAEALFDRLSEGWRLDEMFPPVGSPAYVRDLRDRIVVDTLPRLADDPRYAEPIVAAISHAHSVIRALGYDPPGEGSDK